MICIHSITHEVEYNAIFLLEFGIPNIHYLSTTLTQMKQYSLAGGYIIFYRFL